MKLINKLILDPQLGKKGGDAPHPFNFIAYPWPTACPAQ